MAQAAVTKVKEVRREHGLPYAVIARRSGLAESTLRRWRSRHERQVRLLTVPGPKKIAPLDMIALMGGIKDLRHRRYRSFGAPDLWLKYRDQVSRRDFYGLLARHRFRLRQEERMGWWRYRWLKVGAVWAIDDMEFGRDESDRKLFTSNVMDLGSRNLFEPLDGETMPAGEIADNLDGLMQEHGASIFLKSDCGSNLLKSEEVKRVLAKWCVLPLMSPPRYPRYNGVLERGQSEVRRAVRDLLGSDEICPRRHFRAYAVAGTYRANNLKRDVLGGKRARDVFAARNGEMKTSVRERRFIYEWIKRKKESILLSTAGRREDKRAVNAAWRSAAEEWMLQNKVIEIIPGTRKVSTYFGDYERS